MKNFYAPTSDFAQLISELQSYCVINPAVIAAGAIEVDATILNSIPALTALSEPISLTSNRACWLSFTPIRFSDVVSVPENLLLVPITGQASWSLSLYDINPGAVAVVAEDSIPHYNFYDTVFVEAISPIGPLFLRGGVGFTVDALASEEALVFSCITFNEDISSLFVE